jgi:prevent-host-death family protein
MDISIAEAHNRLSHWIRQVESGRTVRITRRGKPIAVLVDPGEYEHLQRVKAYLEMIRLSRELKDTGLSASEIYRTSREELEGEL